MWKANSIIGKLQFIYHTNNSHYTGWYIIPSLRLFYIKGLNKYSYSHNFSLKFDWLFFGCSINNLSQ